MDTTVADDEGTDAVETRVPVAKFRRLFSYLEEQGVDSAAIAFTAGIDHRTIARAADGDTLPVLYYARLYNQTVSQLQRGEPNLPWGAGIGSKSFRLMASCMIGCGTLGQALGNAMEFESVVSPRIKGDRIALECDGDVARLAYHFQLLDVQQRFVPKSMRGTNWPLVVGCGSGLTVWHAFCGWLIGRTLELHAVATGPPVFPDSYCEKLSRQFGCMPTDGRGRARLEFPAEFLDCRLVHDAASLQDMLANAPYQLMRMDSRPPSTSAAIRSLLGSRFEGGLPSFEDIAAHLGMSPSSLRRRLMNEHTSYQRLKDDCRRDKAVQLLEGSELSVAAIGEKLGFTETSSFIRSFRGWTGSTPRNFRLRSAS